MNRCWRLIILVCVVAAAGAMLCAAVTVYFGWYNVSAVRQHTTPVYRLLDVALTRSVKVRADDIEVPDLNDRAGIQNGFDHFRAHCVQCHGAPGLAPAPYALGLNPAPASLVASARERSAAEIFWIIREGIKMTGMPAWRYRLTEAQTWDVVAFLRVMTTLSPQEYRDWDERQPPQAAPPIAEAASTGDVAAGRQALQQFLCTTCHVIPDVVGAYHHVGPSLAGIASRPFIAGTLPNTPDNMRRWLMAPPAVKPGTAMPDLGIGERDARDIAAFLETLSDPS